MTDIDPRLKERLSAWLDGELPADEARFLQRRLDHDPALRAQFERWQLATACLRGQPVRLMPDGFAARVGDALAGAGPARARWPWAAGVAAAVLVAALLPNMMATDAGRGLPPAPA
ncbi:MAG TPA: sigma-E factor negative regulatory protein, partial [Arenimonas sp.]|uniref:sigma-E factor negative regulatory protein n=1 Tax=Arenimonas sp. TaxID=1872635 RepID=UPI002D7FB622